MSRITVKLTNTRYEEAKGDKDFPIELCADQLYGWAKAGISNGVEGFDDYVKSDWLSLTNFEHLVSSRTGRQLKRTHSVPEGNQKFAERTGRLKSSIIAYSPRTKKYAGTKIGPYMKSGSGGIYSANYLYRWIPKTRTYIGTDREFMVPANRRFHIKKKATEGLAEMIDMGMAKVMRENGYEGT